MQGPARRALPVIAACGVAAAAWGAASPGLASRPRPPVAPVTIRYLYHSGWEVRTARHVLVFDYVEAGRAGQSSADGRIDPGAFAGSRAVVFVSHAHTDHYDPAILEWRKTVLDVRYVFGWETPDAPFATRFGSERRRLAVGDVEVWNVHHAFDGVPESAFLVCADGVTLVHAGDHGHSQGLKNDIFRSNVDYLAGLGRTIDLLFTPTFGGQWDLIDRLKPAVVFPMHDGRRERQYARFATELRSRYPRIQAGAAARPGDCFRYANGRLAPCQERVRITPDTLPVTPTSPAGT